MKLFTIIANDETGPRAAALFTQPHADAAFARMVAASWQSWKGEDVPMPDDPATAYGILTEDPGFFDTIHRDEFDLTAHPVAREARAAINSLMTQIEQMKGLFPDEDGAIAGALEDGETAIAMLTGEREPDSAPLAPQPQEAIIQMIALSRVFTVTTEDDREDIATAAFGSVELAQAAALDFLKGQWASMFPDRPIPTEDAADLCEALEDEGWGGRVQITDHILKAEATVTPEDVPKADPGTAMLEQHYRDAAQARQRDGELEVDDNAVVSLSDDGGAYVSSWMWVSAEDAGLTDDDIEDIEGDCADCGQPAEDRWDDTTVLCRDCHMQRQDDEQEA